MEDRLQSLFTVPSTSLDPYAEPPVFALKTGGFAFLDKSVDPTRRGGDKGPMSALASLSRPVFDGTALPLRSGERRGTPNRHPSRGVQPSCLPDFA
jgi:hypothetical protein